MLKYNPREWMCDKINAIVDTNPLANLFTSYSTVPGGKKLSFPRTSPSFQWNASEVASLATQGSLYIMAKLHPPRLSKSQVYTTHNSIPITVWFLCTILVVDCISYEYLLLLKKGMGVGPILISVFKVGTHDGTSPCNKSQGLNASCELATSPCD